AFRAVGRLSKFPRQGVPFLSDRVQPMVPTLERLKQLIADLDSDKFVVRQKASKELELLGDPAEDALRGVLESKPSMELRKLVVGLLTRLKSEREFWSGERLRLWRAMQVLEIVGSTEAQAVLKTLASGAPTSRITKEAKAALERVARRGGN